MREQQFTYAIGLFQMRVTGKNKGIDTQVGIFLNTLSDRRTIAHQRRACTATHQSDTGPQVRADFQIVLLAAV
ncbi:hypothetical protein D3C78_1945230 [compost metagenome]